MVFIFVEFIRFTGITAPLTSTHNKVARAITSTLQPFLNAKDSRGPIIYSHTALLLGCALPLLACTECLLQGTELMNVYLFWTWYDNPNC